MENPAQFCVKNNMSQVSKLIFSPSGYHNNVIQTVNVEAV